MYIYLFYLLVNVWKFDALLCCKLLLEAAPDLWPLPFKVKVILGEDREATGILLSIDGDDGIVRMELDDQLKILNLRSDWTEFCLD